MPVQQIDTDRLMKSSVAAPAVARVGYLSTVEAGVSVGTELATNARALQKQLLLEFSQAPIEVGAEQKFGLPVRLAIVLGGGMLAWGLVFTIFYLL
jgi:hypothetical protein